MNKEEKRYETSDLAIAAFLMLKEYKLISASREQSGKFRFVFKDPEGTAKSTAVEFISSDCCKFDTHIKNLKKIIF
tara:strand:- start:241 stop:468 length:228 start_codon:yes stop_codon:yes gene_type:complete